MKRFTGDEVGMILNRIEALGYEVVDVGGSRALAEKAFIVDRASALVGADSGMAHISAGLGKPTYVLLPELGPAEFNWYRNTLKHNGARYFEKIRANGCAFDLDLPRAASSSTR